MKKKEISNIRESNYEIMRIISMLFIVLYHILIHGKVIEHASGAMQLFLIFIESIIIIHVNSYVLITGYFQSKSKMKLGKLLSLNNMVWFYKVIIMLILIALGLITMPDLITRIRTYLPLDYGSYWFIGSYLILYLISPILNKIINNTTKKELSKIIILLFFIVSILSTIGQDIYFNTTTGRSLSTFILLYFIGAYIRNYPISESYIMKIFSKEAKQIIYFSLFIILAILSTMCWITYLHLISIDNVMRNLGPIFGYMHISYASPLIIFQSVAYFSFFGTFSFKNKLINRISSCTLAVYLITENIYLRQIIYDLSGLTGIKSIGSSLFIKLILITIIVFIICIIIEMIRKIIFKTIYNMKISNKFRHKYRNYLKKLGLEINW